MNLDFGGNQELADGYYPRQIREASEDILQSQDDSLSLVVPRRVQRTQRRTELSKFKRHPHRALSQSSGPSRASSAAGERRAIGFERQPRIMAPTNTQQSPYKVPQVRDDLTPLKARIEGVLQMFVQQAAQAREGETLAVSALASEGQEMYAQLQRLQEDLEQTNSEQVWSLNHTQEVISALALEAQRTLSQDRAQVAGAIQQANQQSFARDMRLAADIRDFQASTSQRIDQENHYTRSRVNEFIQTGLPGMVDQAVNQAISRHISHPTNATTIQDVTMDLEIQAPTVRPAQHALVGESSAMGGQGPPQKPPKQVRQAAGGFPDHGDSDDSSSVRSISSGEEDEIRQALEKARKRREARKARRAEKAPAGDPPRAPPPPPNPGAVASPGGAQRVVIEHRYPDAVPPPVRHIKLTAITPKAYRGTVKEDLRAWLTEVEQFFATNEWMWTSERQRINFALSNTEDKAQEWARYYTKQMLGIDGIRLVPEFANWVNFRMEIEKRFINRDEALTAKGKWRDLRYTDIETFIQDAVQLNIFMRRTGMDWKDEMLNKVPDKLRERMASKYQIEDEREWLDKLLTIGKAQERHADHERFRNRGLPALDSRGKATEKRSQRYEQGALEARFAHKPTPPAASTPQTEQAPRAPRVRERDSSKPERHNDFAAAHAGVPEDLLKRRRASRACTRCGRQNCWWRKCDAPGPRTVSAAALGRTWGQKRKRNDEGGETAGEVLEKRLKQAEPQENAAATVSSVGLKTMGGVAVHQERPPPRNIYANNSDEDMSDFQWVGSQVRTQPTKRD